MNKICNSNMQRRPHLTKEQRLPKCFKEVEKVIRSVKLCKGHYKTILANSRLRGSIHKKVYSLTVNVLKNYNYIQKIIDKIQLLEKEKYLRREIASILIYELIFGTGILPGESKVVSTIQVYENDIKYAHEVLQSSNNDDFMTVEIDIPRYARVHTLVTTVPYVIQDLISYGYTQVFYEEDLPEEKYLELVKSLDKGSFLVDFHFKDVLVFQHSENLTYLDLYKNGHIFLQDKASYIPVHALNPPQSCTVLDACAAPGIKTVHIASNMKNKGILIACERDKTRFESLKKMLEHGSVKICKQLCKDFKLVDPNDQAYSDVEYILLDPSCSGSGMVNRMSEVIDTEGSKDKERLMKLSGFQIILLKHALKFPSVKKVIYSTCSIHEEENEYVVHEVLNAFNNAFKLVPVMPEWSHRGSESYEFGKLCLRTIPEKHLTNGFFVAMFERINFDKHANGTHFSKNYKQCDVRVAESKTLPYDKINSGYDKCKKKSLDLKKVHEKKIINEISTENYYSQPYQERDETDMIGEQKHMNSNDVQEKYKHKKKKNVHQGEYLYDPNNKRRADMIVEKVNSDDVQEKNKHKKKKEKYSVEYQFNKRNSIDIVDEQEHANFDDVQERKKKEKHSGWHESNENENTDMNDELEQMNSDDKQEKNKHKKKKKEKQLNECPCESSEDRKDIIAEQGQMNSNDVQIRNKHKKKKKRKHSDECDSNERESTEMIDQQEWVNSDGVQEKNKHKKKKKEKHSGVQESNERDSTNVIGEQEQVNSDGIQEKHKHKKKKKEKHSDYRDSTNTMGEQELVNSDVQEKIKYKKKEKHSSGHESNVRGSTDVIGKQEQMNSHDVQESNKRKKKKKEKQSNECLNLMEIQQL